MRIHPYATLAARAARANAARLAFPMKLTFSITCRCNYKCQTCNIWKVKPQNELSLDEIRRFFQCSNRFSWVDVTGGEISLRNDFVDICEAVVTYNRDLVLLHYPTNGYLTDRVVEYTREVARMGPPKLLLTVSVDGDEEMNDRIRGVPGGYRRQIESFRRLREIPGVEVVLGMTLSAQNVDHFPAAFAAAKREIPNLTVRDFHVNIVHQSPHYLRNDELGLCGEVDPEALALATETHAALRGARLSPVNYLERSYLKGVRPYLESGRTPMRCHALRSSCFIDSWGDVFPCTIYAAKLGSLRDHDYDLAALWRGDRARTLQREIWGGDCPHCWTPCEAYQSIMGNFLRIGRRAGARL